MSLYILGTGRSGTLSVATALGGRHEPYSEVICGVAAKYTAKAISGPDAARILKDVTQLGDVSAHYRYAEIIELLLALDDDARFLWVRRDTDDTVASMVRKNWYAHADDDLWPVQIAAWADDGTGRTILRLDNNHQAFRPNPVWLGASLHDWRGLSQEQRCRWWCAFVEARLSEGLPQLGAPYAIVALEDLDGESLREIADWAGLGVRPASLPHMNKGGS